MSNDTSTPSAAKKVKKEPSTLSKSINRVLALSMRPNDLTELIGQTHVVESIQKQMTSGRIPHFFIIAGPVGAGKTTLAKIISKKILKSADIREINAANKNGVDDVRYLVENMRYKPVFPSQSKVVILDEAHQLTNAAQNALNTETEDVADYVFYIFCTSNVNKIIPALKRRAFVINPEPLQNKDIDVLVGKAAKLVSTTGTEPLKDTTELLNVLKDANITSPGLILQAAERFFSGLSATNSVLFTEDSKVDTLQFCRVLSTGNWKACSDLLKDGSKTDVPALRNCALGYLKSILLKTSGTKAIDIAKAISHLAVDSVRADEGASFPLFLSSVCLTCDALGTKTTVTKKTKS